MSIYPAIEPVTATYDSKGRPLPPGMVYEDGALQLPGFDFITDPAQLGTSNPALGPDILNGAMRMLAELAWIVGGYIPVGFVWGTGGSGNFTEEFSLKVHSINGGAVRFENSGSEDDPRNLNIQGDFIPDDPGNPSGPKHWEGIKTSLQVADQCIFKGVQALITHQPDFSNAAYTEVTLNRDLGLATGDIVKVWRPRPPKWPYLVPARSLFHVRKSITSAEALVALTQKDGSGGRIAWPVADFTENDVDVRGTFKVIADGEDITATILAGFPSPTHRLQITWDTVGGAWKSTLNLVGLGYTNYSISYCVEVADQNNPGATDEKAWKPGGCENCKYCIRDFSDSMKAPDPGVGNDADGKTWFCEKMRETGILTSKFQPGFCFLTDCPGYVVSDPWRPNLTDLGTILFSRDIYLKQTTPGIPIFSIGRDKVPSLFFQAGMRSYTGSGLYIPTVIWMLKAGPNPNTGTLGRELVDKDPLLIDESSDVQMIQFDAENVFQINPFREMMNIDAYLPGTGSVPTGPSESQVQRIRQIPVEFSMGDSEYEGLYATAALVGNTLTIDLVPFENLEWPTKLTADVEFKILNAAKTILQLHFKPSVVATYSAATQAVVTNYWLTAGDVVLPDNDLRIYNPATTGRLGTFGAKSKGLVVGDTIEINGSRLTCVHVESHYEQEFSGTINGVSSATAPNGKNIPDLYFAESWRLAMDAAWFEITTPGLGDWIAANPIDQVEISTRAVLPFATNQYGAAVPRTLNITVNGQVATPSVVDRAIGQIQFDTSAWPAQPWKIEIDADFYDRFESVPAELYTGIKNAIADLLWFKGGGFLNSIVLVEEFTQPPNYRLLTALYHPDIGFTIGSQSDFNLKWKQPANYTKPGIGAGEDLAVFFGEELYQQPIITFVTPNPRLTPDLIDGAKIDIKFDGAKMFENEYAETNSAYFVFNPPAGRPSVPHAYGVELTGDLEVALVTIKVRDNLDGTYDLLEAFEGSNISLPNDGLYHTVDITETVKLAAGQPLGKQRKIRIHIVRPGGTPNRSHC